MEAEARRPAGNGSNLEAGIVPGPAQGRGQTQYSFPRRVVRFLCMYGRPDRLQVQYSPRFRLFMAFFGDPSDNAWLFSMGDDEERQPPGVYTLVTEEGEKKTSIGFTGKATANYANGDIYEGLFENGIRQGAGVYTYLKGDVFTGTFENNLKTGLGRITYKKGGYFHGHFKDGKRNGEGTLLYANGDIYSGEWKDGKKHGPGTYVFNKTKYEYKGTWKDGQIVTGTWTLTDGTQYRGSFQSQKPCGDSTWTTRQGTIVEGSYVQQVVPVDSAPPAKPGETPAVVTRCFWSTAALVS